MQKSNPPQFLTITLDPSMYVYKSKVQLERTLPIIKKVLKGSIYYASFELTKNSNIHYHILVCDYKPVKSPSFYWRNKFRRGTTGKFDELGFNKCTVTNTSDEINKAIAYINKCHTETTSIMDTPSVFSNLNDEWVDRHDFSSSLFMKN